MLRYKEDVSNRLGVNINKNSDGAFELLKSHQVDKILNHAGLAVSTSLKSRETPARKPLLHKEESSIGIKCAYN